jgi:predicted protein tyrosine phosphatase
MRLLVCPLEEVAQVVAARKPSHLISLLSPRAATPDPPQIAADRRLALAFNDIATPIEGLIPPTLDDIAALLAFGTRAEGATVLVHCWAGVSRSPAAAFVLACQRRPAGQEATIAVAMRRAAPYATPNPLIVALADQLLERGGAMRRAIAGIGRGAETGLGSSFLLTDSGAAPLPSG